jgi:hypothetical protein
MFDPPSEVEQESKRLARRRIALIGIGTGAVMALLMLLCVLLLYLAVNSGS